MLTEGLNLALFGMGAVFIFLALLIFVTRLMSSVVRLIDVNAANIQPVALVRARPEQRQTTADDARLKAILSAAIKQYQSKH